MKKNIGFLIASIGFYLASFMWILNDENLFALSFFTLGCVFLILHLKKGDKSKQE